MKKHIGKEAIIPAMPICVIAAQQGEKINFAPCGQVGTVTAEPSIVYISVIKEHLTAQIIIKEGKFSISIPDTSMLQKIQYCGSISGNNADKSGAFEIFYGDYQVPMLKESSLSFVCKQVQTIELNEFYLFLGEVLETYAEEDCLSEHLPDIRKIDPLLCSIDGSFWGVGKEIKQADL